MKDENLIILEVDRPPIVRRKTCVLRLALMLLALLPAARLHSADRSPFIRVLGTVQDGGLPHAACSCDRCNRARTRPGVRRLVASLALVLPAAGEIYLVDATPDLREQLVYLNDLGTRPEARVDRQPVAGIFLTHAHIGHYLGLAFLGYEAIHSRGIPVMATPRMCEFLRRNGPWSQLVDLDNIRLVEMPPGERRELGAETEIRAVQAPHRDEYADTLGFLIVGPERSVFYLPDTDSWSAWSPPITAILQQVDVAILDGTFFSADELPERRVEEIGHPLIQDSLKLLGDLVDRHGLEVYFTHLNHSNPALDPGSDARRLIEERGFSVLAEGHEIPL